MSKIQKILSGVVVLQILLAAAVFYAQRPIQAEASMLMEGYDPEAITKVSITDAEGKQVVFQRQNGMWVLPENGDFPLMGSGLEDVLENAGMINTNRLVASNSTSHNRLQVEADNFQRKLVLETSDGQQTILYLGSSPAASSTHIRLEGENNVYLTNAVSAFQLNTSLSSWIDINYLQLSAAQLQSIQIQTADENYAFVVDADGNWTTSQVPEGQVFDSNKWNNLLTSLTMIRMSEPVGKEIRPEYGLDSPSASVVYVYMGEDGSEQTDQLIIGSPTLDGLGYYAKLDSAEYIIKLNKAAAEKITLLTPEAFSSSPIEETAQP